jgi:hypothetical protein
MRPMRIVDGSSSMRHEDPQVVGAAGLFIYVLVALAVLL